MTTSPYGRAAIQWPDLGSPAGEPLHAELTSGISVISNNLNARWSGNFASFLNGNSLSMTHGFGLASSSLHVVVEEGTAILDTKTRDEKYTITYTDDNNLSITNASGGTISNFSFYVMPRRFVEMQSLEIAAVTNSTATGTNATLSTPATGLLRVTNASLVSVTNITAPTRGMFFALYNDTGVNITINNDTGGTASARIITGTGANIVLTAGASLLLFYDLIEQRWLVVGGAGSGGYSNSAVLNLAGGGTIAGVQSGLNKYRVAGNSGPVTLANAPFGSTAPLDGTEVVLVGNSNTNGVTLVYSDTAKGFVGNGNCELLKGSTLTVIYDATLDRWFEKSRVIISIA